MKTLPRPVGGPLLTRPFLALIALVAIAVALVVWRFAAGLGPVTNLSDGYPWGLWIAFDVVAGTALACGGYAVALLAYVLNRGQYHPMVRPAILTSALGYTVAAVAIVIDVGRYWNIWKIPIFFWEWNLNSVLLEVALCVMAYVMVLWIELSPAFLEHWAHSPRPALRRISKVGRPVIERALLWLIALGLLLPTMHQSSLGSVLLIASSKLHPLWHTPMLPLLFLVSCVAMGYAAVVFESSLASLFFGRPMEERMLAGLSKVMAGVLITFLVIRFGDLAYHGRLGLVFTATTPSVLFLIECVLFAVPAVLMLFSRARTNPGMRFQGAMMMMLAGIMYRFDVYIFGFNPGAGWSYFPSVAEMLITVGIVAAEVAAYIVIVKKLPILSIPAGDTARA
ncbi:MAG: Ni/Fe-hydrogenase cytochrome b subunit [Myxococcota bacterium]